MFGLVNEDDPEATFVRNLRTRNNNLMPPDWLLTMEHWLAYREEDIESCLNKCNMHGVCFGGVCFCEEGFAGD